MTPGIRSVNRLAVAKTATTNIVLATLGLAVPTGPGARHHVKWWVPFTQVGVAAGSRFQLINPAAITSMVLSFFIWNLVTKAIDNAGLQVASAAFLGTGASAGNYLLQVECEVINGVNAGSLDLQFAQNVSDVGTLTMLAGSWVEDVVF